MRKSHAGILPPLHSHRQQPRETIMAKRKATPARGEAHIGKRVVFDKATWAAVDLYARDSLRTFQELADEAFADLLKKHGRPTDLKDALRKSASLPKTAAPKNARSSPSRKPKS